MAAPQRPSLATPPRRGAAIGVRTGGGARAVRAGPAARGVSRPLGLGSRWLRTELPSFAAMEDDRKDAVYGRSSLQL